MKTTKQEFNTLVEQIKQDDNVFAFWLDGSRGKGMETKNSDYDARMIVNDKVLNEYKQKYGSKVNPEIEISVMTVKELKEYAKYGSDMFWDRYNFVGLKVLFDKVGGIQEIINEKQKLELKEKNEIINNNLGSFINQIYRMEKNIRDNNMTAAKLEAIEAIPFLLEIMFACENRIRPYNKYLEWELEQRPFTKFTWSKDEFIQTIFDIVQKEKLEKLFDIFIIVKLVLQNDGYTKEFNEWEGYYKVGQ